MAKISDTNVVFALGSMYENTNITSSFIFVPKIKSSNHFMSLRRAQQYCLANSTVRRQRIQEQVVDWSQSDTQPIQTRKS